ncbi:MAG: PilZ domain-containing protein [Spirochaetes bacterium]|nr:PilZ domain-containing protein [Spirochaetota bacterium]
MEKRNTVRVPFHVRAIVKYEGKEMEGEVENLSTGGMLFTTTDGIPVDAAVTMSIILYGSSSHLALNCAGRVVRRTDRGVAIRFTELDIDSFIHLRNIVSRNAYDDKTVMKEFEDFNAG